MSLRRLLSRREPAGVSPAPSASPADCRRLRAVVAAVLGLQLDSLGERGLADALERRARARGAAVQAYLAWLEAGPDAAELDALAQELTIGETYFFRNLEQFEALRDWIVARRARDGRPIRVLSAGCASGEEPYSIEMLLRDALPGEAGAWSIRAVDVNPAMIDKARRARYTHWALREAPPAMLRRWLRPDGAGLALDDAIRDAVVFEQRNLCADDADLWPPGAYDVVFCRNVLIHLARPAAEALAARLVHSVAPGGALFLGHAETLRGLAHDVVAREAHGAFWYERAPAGAAAAVAEAAPPGAAGLAADAAGGPSAAASRAAGGGAVVPPASPARPVPAAASFPRPLPAQASASPSWAAPPAPAPAVGSPAASGAVSPPAPLAVPAATSSAAAPPASAVPPSAAAPEADMLARAFELLGRERYAEALAQLRALPDAAAGEPPALLLQGVLLAHGGDYGQASRLGLRLLAADESHADAYHLIALCREGQGDHRGALDCERRAVALDPGFALARMHLGRLARRAGDRAEVRRQFGRAVALLDGEDAARLALFGGGFGREALLAMCRAELLACGEPA